MRCIYIVADNPLQKRLQTQLAYRGNGQSPYLGGWEPGLPSFSPMGSAMGVRAVGSTIAMDMNLHQAVGNKQISWE